MERIKWKKLIVIIPFHFLEGCRASKMKVSFPYQRFKVSYTHSHSKMAFIERWPINWNDCRLIFGIQINKWSCLILCTYSYLHWGVVIELGHHLLDVTNLINVRIATESINVGLLSLSINAFLIYLMIATSRNIIMEELQMLTLCNVKKESKGHSKCFNTISSAGTK